MSSIFVEAIEFVNLKPRRISDAADPFDGWVPSSNVATMPGTGAPTAFPLVIKEGWMLCSGI
jgi:hypothetical protein